jgi:RNA polymerase sigma-70 factor (ECF subfamily)
MGNSGGPPEDLTAFCRREHPRLVGALSLYCGSVSLAEELAQEALARVCRDWSRVRRMAHPGAWAQRIAINLANSQFRRWAAERRARQRLEAGALRQDHAPDDASAITIRDAVAALPRRQRTALVLHYFCDLPFAEVARLMESPEPTVKSLARRAVQRLQAEAGITDALEAAPDAL